MTQETKNEKPLSLIVPPPTKVEDACLKLDSALDRAVNSVKEIRAAVKYLRTMLDHPFHVEALANIDGLLDEALIPYLAEVDKEFRNIAAT